MNSHKDKTPKYGTSTPLRELVEQMRGKQVSILTGAGMSTESGLPDFRSGNGLWENYPLEELASVDALEANFEAFSAFYKWRIRMVLEHAPHEGHRLLEKWQRLGLINWVITQNVDGYHQAVGASKVLPLHGDIRRIFCTSCSMTAEHQDYMSVGGEYCPCGGKRRPGITLFGEALDEAAIKTAFEAAIDSDILLVLGSSLQVSPARRLPMLTAKHKGDVVIVNAEATDLDPLATLLVRDSIKATLEEMDGWNTQLARAAARKALRTHAEQNP